MDNALNQEELNIIRGVRIHRLLTLSDDGRSKIIKCPFHSEKTASFVVYKDNSYHCFGCKKNGTGAIDFVMDLGFGFNEALQELSKYL